MELLVFLTFGLFAFGSVLAMENKSQIDKERENAGKQAGDLIDRLKALVSLPALYVYDWQPSELQDRVNTYMGVRDNLLADAKAIYKPILDAIDKLGSDDPFGLFAQIDTATININGLYSRAAQAAVDGQAVATEAIKLAKEMWSKADAELASTFDQCGDAAVKAGWPAEVFENQKAWEFYVKRNTNYRAAKAKADNLKSSMEGLQQEVYAFQRRVDEIRIAASRAATRSLAL